MSFGIIILSILLFVFFITIFVTAIKKKHRDEAYAYVVDNAAVLLSNNGALGRECRELGLSLSLDRVCCQEYIFSLRLNDKISCSRNVLSSARNDLIRYFIKYSEIPCEEDTLEKIDFIIRYQRDLGRFHDLMDHLADRMRSKLPANVLRYVKPLSAAYVICGLSVDGYSMIVPRFTFFYCSPAGRSQSMERIDFNEPVLQALSCAISDKIYQSGSADSQKDFAKMQRSRMTKDLREAIKLRDNYTCRICGNSVYNEPNLLLEVDHIIPVSKGGKTEASNLQTLCWRCNRAKSNRM